jgi:hypothetical protein
VQRLCHVTVKVGDKFKRHRMLGDIRGIIEIGGRRQDCELRLNRLYEARSRAARRGRAISDDIVVDVLWGDASPSNFE